MIYKHAILFWGAFGTSRMAAYQFCHVCVRVGFVTPWYSTSHWVQSPCQCARGWHEVGLNSCSTCQHRSYWLHWMPWPFHCHMTMPPPPPTRLFNVYFILAAILVNPQLMTIYGQHISGVVVTSGRLRTALYPNMRMLWNFLFLLCCQ